MRGFRLGVPGSVSTLVVLTALASCGEDAQRPLASIGAGDAGQAGEADGSGGSARGGRQGNVGGTSASGRSGSGGGTSASGGSDSAGAAGEGTSATGGSGGTSAGGDATGGTGATGGNGGTSEGGSAGSGATGGSAAGEGGGAGEGEPPLEQLTVCSRVSSPAVTGSSVSRGYEVLVIADCHVNWVTSLYYDTSIGLDRRSQFFQQLLSFTYQLWGCAGHPPPERFALVYDDVALSAADAATLIDHYVDIATSVLTLSPQEIADMRAILARHAEPLVELSGEQDYSNPRCNGGAGGAGGSSGGAG
ncbi:MAG TPA: hypothetical protein VGK73_29705, partial [Polyangiaceae bacterium]